MENNPEGSYQEGLSVAGCTLLHLLFLWENVGIPADFLFGALLSRQPVEDADRGASKGRAPLSDLTLPRREHGPCVRTLAKS